MEGIPYLEMDELMVLFGYKNVRALRSAIRAGRFPVKLYELAGRRVASVTVVNAYFEHMAEETMADSPAPGASPPALEEAHLSDADNSPA